jgi:hypothetical protein
MRDQLSQSRKQPTRRSILLQGAAGITGVAIGLATALKSAQAAKLPQKSVGYRPTPNGDRDCSNCKLFVAPDECEKVAGKVSPRGYCLLYQKA